MPLTDLEVRRAKPRSSNYKLFDAGGLFILVQTNGRKYWRMRYQFGGAEKSLSFGPYPEVSLSAARQARDAAKATLRLGKDPSTLRKLAKARQGVAGERSFEEVARAWHRLHAPRWAVRHAADVIDSLERLVFPKLGTLDIDDITASMVLKVIRSIEATTIETARRVRQRMSSVFLWAVAQELTDRDPAAIIKGAMAPAPRKQSRAAILDLEACRTMLHTVEETPSHPVTLLCMRFLALTHVRPGEARALEWIELEDLHGPRPIWRIPEERMKGRRDHLVPLSRQAAETLLAVRALTSMSRYVFPNARTDNKPLSENALGYLLNRAGYHGRHVPHGWRSSFSTIMNERHREDRQVIDLMLAHVPENAVEASYNRADHMDRRRTLTQEWADLLLAGFEPARRLLNVRRR